MRLPLAALVFQFFAAPLLAETFEQRHARDVAGNPNDLRFDLVLKGGTRARIGERIPLTLSFSSQSLNKYKLNGATYDRSGRLPTEEFVLDRDGAIDPYQDYFGTGVLGLMGGGLRSYPVLEPKPYEIDLNLNDWFRFDRPGRYRLYLKSHRLTRESAPGEHGERTVQFAAVSNIIHIEILPEDAAWNITKLEAIRATLDETGTERTETATAAWSDLRYLSTPEAVRLAVEYAGRPA